MNECQNYKPPSVKNNSAGGVLERAHTGSWQPVVIVSSQLVLVTANQGLEISLWWEHLYQGNWKMLHITAFFPLRARCEPFTSTPLNSPSFKSYEYVCVCHVCKKEGLEGNNALLISSSANGQDLGSGARCLGPNPGSDTISVALDKLFNLSVPQCPRL